MVNKFVHYSKGDVLYLTLHLAGEKARSIRLEEIFTDYLFPFISVFHSYIVNFCKHAVQMWQFKKTKKTIASQIRRKIRQIFKEDLD